MAGESYQLEINYNTDAAVVGTGHWFDNVRWTNVSFQVCDAQSDLCTPCTPPDAPTGLTAAASGPNQIQLDWNAVAPAPSQLPHLPRHDERAVPTPRPARSAAAP